jgi:hypothetical protein
MYSSRTSSDNHSRSRPRDHGGGIPGALHIGSTYFLYTCTNGIAYSTSTDGLNFTVGGTAIAGAGAGPQSDVTHMASSTDGRTWTDLGLVGAGSVPGLVKDRSGTLRIYVVGF